ncbi:hypothetical protein PC129_g14628 [Phytophthora cactorum]|uniref:Uncharacterized protein n=1 Tax=Phytophthora cactorum TaxID=29920 RepID=A0A329SGN5_9STRA|nr:hypothetical protein Pcac1_g4487 [Phytophthora cactorum]KAG2797602.1 hypothetical protein PC111_g21225 [Phytophthora cactorum]KAG2797672.1 hypothetical protein PC112_g21679 [Phytophthora cactorum]KAG2860261.1 hypothetical protein PC113_g8199 [Phytophthora cactorum]KAG2876967.1 hypothetical protein PC114_g23904 [Phytophthora cactorum]
MHLTSVGKDVVPVFMSVLRTQALEYDVRPREMEERDATQAKEIDEYGSDRGGFCVIKSIRGACEPAVAMATGGTLGPAAAEAKLQEELRKRVQKLNEFWRSVAGFIESLDLVK